MLLIDGGGLAILGVANEIALLLQRVEAPAMEPAGPLALTRARFGGRDLYLVACGMGKVNAAMATQALIERYHPDAILSCGSAGGLAPDMRPGDLVIGERVMQHDAGVHLGPRFVHVGVQVQDAGRPKTQRVLCADANLIEVARAAAGALSGERRAQVGLVATGDQVIFSDERAVWLRETCGALAVDMESAAVAQVAQTNGVPWLAIRAISDAANAAAGFDVSRLVEYVDEAPATTLARRLAYLAAHPTTPAKLQKLRAGIQIAAERATKLTLAVIERL